MGNNSECGFINYSRTHSIFSFVFLSFEYTLVRVELTTSGSISRSNNCSLVVFWSVVCNHIFSLLPSQSFNKKQVSISLHPQTTTPNKQTFLRLQTLPWTGTPIAIEFNIPLPQEGQSLSKASHLILFRAQPLGGVGTSRKAPEPDQLILFTERRHVGGKKKYKCWYCRLQICEL